MEEAHAENVSWEDFWAVLIVELALILEAR